jgi:hypothetical protein
MANDRERYLLREYGLPASVYDAMEAGQQGRCAICRRRPGGGMKLVVDHDHVTGQVRGLLCNDCNLFLGRAEAYLAATNSGYRPPLWLPGQNGAVGTPNGTAKAKGARTQDVSLNPPTLPPVTTRDIQKPLCDPDRDLLLALQSAGSRGAKVLELARKTGRQKSWVYTRLGGLLAEGLVERLQHSRWRLVGAGEDAADQAVADSTSGNDPLEVLVDELGAAGKTGMRADDLAVIIGRSRAWVFNRLGELERGGHVVRCDQNSGYWRLRSKDEKRGSSGNGPPSWPVWDGERAS